MKSITIQLELVATGEHVEEVVELSPQLLAKALLDLGYEIAINGYASFPRIPGDQFLAAAGSLRAKLIETKS